MRIRSLQIVYLHAPFLSDPLINVFIRLPLPVSTSFLIIPSHVCQGEITIESPLDRETKNHYTLTAVARDNPGGSPSNRRENAVQVGTPKHGALTANELQGHATVLRPASGPCSDN